MNNLSSVSNNMIQAHVSGITTLDPVRMALLTITLICFLFFVYCITMILNVYFTSPHVREHVRYILFAHMLINDSLYLVVGLILTVTSLFVIRLPVPICYLIFTLATSTFRITPYNLAAMALERYIAICFPLRHVTLWTAQRSNAAITLIWVIGVFPGIADFIALNLSANRTFYSLFVICTRDAMTIHPLQSTIRTCTLVTTLSLVAVLILFTYIKVMLVAQQIRTKHSSAFKAGKTVMLHAVQLLLCMTSLTSSFVEPYFREKAVFMLLTNFLIFMLLPRLLSPLIFGMRDEVFKHHLKKFYPQNLKFFTVIKIRIKTGNKISW